MESCLSVLRDVYNSLVNERTFLWETEKQGIHQYEQEKHFKQWRAKFPEIQTVHSHLLQDVALRVHRAFTAFFRRVKAGDKKTASGGFSETPGYPRLKGYGTYDSFTFKEYGNGVKLDGETLSLSKIGQVKCIVHRKIIGTVKTCTIRRLAGKWFACLSCEYDLTPLPASTQTIGIDVGLNQFAALATAPRVPCVRAEDGDTGKNELLRSRSRVTVVLPSSLSDGTFVANPRFFRRDEKALTKAGRRQAKTKRGSILRRKANKVLSRIHERIRNRRHDFVHQTARRIVNKFGLIAVEDLNVKNLTKRAAPKVDAAGDYLPNGAGAKSGLNQSLQDAAWSLFRKVLSNKAENAGRFLVAVNPAYTSQDCSECGYRPDKKKTLKDRWHFCPKCGLSLDRDTNAAWNILNTALGTKPVWGNTPGIGSPIQEAPVL